MPQYQIPQWLIPTETPGQALARGVESGATIARGFNENYWRSKDEERQNALEPLRRQQMAMAIKNQALDVEINQAKMQTMLAQKESYADLANFNAQVASQPDGYLKDENFSKFWQLGQQHPALLSDPVFANTMQQFHTAKQMKALQDYRKDSLAQKDRAEGDKDFRNQNSVQGRILVADANNAAKLAAVNAKREAFSHFDDIDIKNKHASTMKQMDIIAKALNVRRSKGLGTDDAESKRQQAEYYTLRNKLDDLDAETAQRVKDRANPGGVKPDISASPEGIPSQSGPGWGAHRQSEDSVPVPESVIPPIVTSGPAYDANKQRLQRWQQQGSQNNDPLNLLGE